MPRRVEILTSPTPSTKMAPSTAISAASEERCGPSAVAVRPMTANPAAVIVTAGPLASSEAKAEKSLGEHRQEDEPA